MKKGFSTLFKGLTFVFLVHLILQEYTGWRFAAGIQEILYSVIILNVFLFALIVGLREKLSSRSVVLTGLAIQLILYYYMIPYLLDDPSINWTL